MGPTKTPPRRWHPQMAVVMDVSRKPTPMERMALRQVRHPLL